MNYDVTDDAKPTAV